MAPVPDPLSSLILPAIFLAFLVARHRNVAVSVPDVKIFKSPVRDRRLQAYKLKSLERKSKISVRVRFSFTQRANVSFKRRPASIRRFECVQSPS